MGADLREVIGDGLYVSVSQVKAFLKCPRLFELHYIRGEAPEFIPRALAFGSAFHGALAQYYTGIQSTGSPPVLAALAETFKALWDQKHEGGIPVEGANEADEDGQSDVIDLAVRMLRTFHAQAALPADTTVEAVELPFSAGLYDPETGEELEEKLVGVMDLVLLEDKNPVVVEHKSSAKRYSAEQLRNDIQVTAYQLALHDADWHDVSLRYQIVTKTKNPQVQLENVVRTEQDENDFLRLTLGVLRSIDAGVSYPVRSWACKGCPYRSPCNTLSRPVRKYIGVGTDAGLVHLRATGT